MKALKNTSRSKEGQKHRMPAAKKSLVYFDHLPAANELHPQLRYWSSKTEPVMRRRVRAIPKLVCEFAFLAFHHAVQFCSSGFRVPGHTFTFAVLCQWCANCVSFEMAGAGGTKGCETISAKERRGDGQGGFHG